MHDHKVFFGHNRSRLVLQGWRGALDEIEQAFTTRFYVCAVLNVARLPFGPDSHHRKHHTSGPSFRCSRITLPCCMSSSSLGLRYRIRGTLDGMRAFSWTGAEKLSCPNLGTPDNVCNCRGKAITANSWR